MKKRRQQGSVDSVLLPNMSVRNRLISVMTTNLNVLVEKHTNLASDKHLIEECRVNLNRSIESILADLEHDKSMIVKSTLLFRVVEFRGLKTAIDNIESRIKLLKSPLMIEVFK